MILIEHLNWVNETLYINKCSWISKECLSGTERYIIKSLNDIIWPVKIKWS